MMGTGTVPKTSVTFNQLTPLIGREDFIKLQNTMQYVGFDVLTPVARKRDVFWDITPCSPLSVNRRFGRTCRLHVGYEVLTAVVMKSYIKKVKLSL
jgi:hypothetical protein